MSVPGFNDDLSDFVPFVMNPIAISFFFCSAFVSALVGSLGVAFFVSFAFVFEKSSFPVGFAAILISFVTSSFFTGSLIVAFSIAFVTAAFASFAFDGPAIG